MFQHIYTVFPNQGLGKQLNFKNRVRVANSLPRGKNVAAKTFDVPLNFFEICNIIGTAIAFDMV